MILYKYTTYDTALKILLENKFRYTQPICFNDPFEIYPVFEGMFSDEQFEEMLDAVLKPEIIDYVYDTQIQSSYSKLNIFQQSLFPYERYYSYMKNGIHGELEKRNISLRQFVKGHLFSEENDLVTKIKLEYLKLINSNIGMFCLSEKNNDILMWSHYSDSHAGVVLKIRAEKSYFEFLDKVIYPKSKERPKMLLSKREYTKQESIEMYKKIFFSKSSNWSYEKEYRDFKPLNNGKDSNLVDDAGYPIILFEFPKDFIEGVIFGVRVDENKIIEFMTSIECTYNNIIFEKAFLNQEKYTLDIFEIKKAG